MSQIEWTEKTWNPIVGCSIVSPGCTNCYAMRQAARIEKMNPDLAHYRGTTQPSKAGPVWTGKVALSERALLEPLRRRKPTTWFVNSMGDLFHEDAPDEWIDRVFAVMALTPQHTFQILTKRAERMREYCSSSRKGYQIARHIVDFAIAKTVKIDARWPVVSEGDIDIPDDIRLREWPLGNVWLGVSAEDQRRADERIPDLLATPAAVRFVSAEPLLGPIDFTRIDDGGAVRINALESAERIPGALVIDRAHVSGAALDWIIVGGESGPNARPMQVPWARSIVQQCKASGVACFVKQLGADPIWEDGAFLNLAHRKGADMAEWPDDLRVREVPDATA